MAVVEAGGEHSSSRRPLGIWQAIFTEAALSANDGMPELCKCTHWSHVVELQRGFR